MRFHLFRSRAFWFGMPGLVFLLWAWVDSGKYDSTLIAAKGQRFVSVSQQFGYLQIQDSLYDKLLPTGVTRTRTPRADPSPSWLPMPAENARIPRFRHDELRPGWIGVRYNTERMSSDFLTLPHWFLLSLYLLPWAAVVAWRWRRFRRATERMASMPAGPLPLDCSGSPELSSGG
ncbi:hypothetical protein [Luteolibacter soli]|uniref:DUF3592 domain-containing protein n=1 Tax=Luteolibacter soli TaxID=3135280 RepID=A0ABU9AQI1_9BACT